MGLPKFPPPPPKHAKPASPPKAAVSVIAALETAVLLLEQSGYTEEMIFGLVNCCLKGFIRNGEWAPEYLEMVAEMQREEAAKAAEDARVQALRDSISSSIITK